MLGLALQGGGAKGAFQAGAIKALFEAGYTFDGVVGASIGALNGALVAQGDFEKTYELWYNMDVSVLFDVDQNVVDNITSLNVDKETVKYVFRKLREVISKRGLDRSKGRDMILSYINEDKLRSSPIDYGLITIECGEKYTPLMLFKEDVPNGLLADYIIASGNLPIFNDLMVGDKKYYDGGMSDNLPINMLIDKGYKDIIAIRLGNSIAPIKAVKDKSVRITYIDPSEKPGSILNFTNSSVRRAMILGYYDTKRALCGYVGKKYYIYPIGERSLYNFMNSLPYPFYEECGKLLNITMPALMQGAAKRLVDEMKQLMKMKPDATDCDCVINLIEIFADYSGVERFKIYELKELALITIKAYIKKIDLTGKKYDKKIEKIKGVFDLYINSCR